MRLLPRLLLPLVLTLAPLVPCTRARAQHAEYAPMVLQLPASARALALGDAWTAGRDVDAVFYNPAQLAGQRVALGFSLGRWGGASTHGTLVGAYPFWRGVIGYGVQMLEWGVGDDRYSGAAPGSAGLTVRGPFNAASTALTLGYGMVIKGFRWGLATKYAEDRAGANRDGVTMVDFGAGRDLGPVSLAIAVRNLGSDPKWDGRTAYLPTRIALGATTFSRPVGAFDVTFNGEVAALRHERWFGGVGTEWTWTPIEGISGTGRLGVRTPVGDAESPVTLGAAFTLDRVMFEYGWEGIRGPGNGHRVGLRVR